LLFALQDTISVVTEATRGLVERVEASKIQSELKSKPVCATGVMALICLNKGLHFKGEFDDELERRNWLVRDLGTVHAQDEITCRCGVACFCQVKAFFLFLFAATGSAGVLRWTCLA
jgi:hypothetical protein